MLSQAAHKHRFVSSTSAGRRARLQVRAHPVVNDAPRLLAQREPADSASSRPQVTAEQNFWRTSNWGG